MILRPEPGTYALLLEIRQPARVEIGRLGWLTVLPGYYVYLGSALGPGGVASRCGHHLRINPRPHWHLDYLRPLGEIREIWVIYGPERREHAWTALLATLPEVTLPFPGFGASDCRCPTHLPRFPRRPSWYLVRNAFRARFPGPRAVRWRVQENVFLTLASYGKGR